MKKLLVAAISAALIVVPVIAGAQDLALKRVTLSSAGLGYFEYESRVDGDAILKLTVPLDQVDDVLKSLVVYDDKGGVGGISLPGREPLQQAFKDLPFDQSSLQTPADLLAKLKGAQVTVSGGRTLSGRIVSVQPETTAGDGKTVTGHTRITLMTDQGLQQFVLEEAENLQFANPALRDELAKALLAIQNNRAMEARTLELSTRGQGTRVVRVAYIVSVPVWKASYRLTLPGDLASPKATVQGWATFENLSGQDWKEIDLTLVSGRPVAFHQALYEAYYVTRPEVPVEVAGRLTPDVDRGAVQMNTKAPSPSPGSPGSMRQLGGAAETAGRPQSVAQGAEQLEATDTTTQVAFKFGHPVSVENGRTVSLPILDRQVPAERLAVYQGNAAAHNPLAAIRLSNDGDSGLPPGILTIYERDKTGNVAYVGDARLSAFPSGETRLLAYAVDERITVERDPSQSQRLVSGSVVNGALRLTQVQRQTTTYRVRGPAKEPRKLVVVQHRLPGWTLVKPETKDIEVSEGNYRLPFQLPGGEQTETFEVVQEQSQLQTVRLLDTSADQIKVYAAAKEFDAKTREALQRVLQLQQQVAEAAQHLTQIDEQRQRIVQEQARVRDNLGSVPANSDLQRRYLAALEKQENDLDELAKRHATTEKAVDAARDALRSFVAQLG